MSITEWTSTYPISLDNIITNMVSLANNVSVFRTSQFHALRNAIIELEKLIGSDSLEVGSIREQLSNISSESTAIHTDIAGEIYGITLKNTPVSNDILVIEDSESSPINQKKRITIGSLPGGQGGTDINAVHVNTASEISGIAPKVSPIAADMLLIEDSADINSKKMITIGSLPWGVDSTAMHPTTSGEIYAFTIKNTPLTTDLIMIEDIEDTYKKKKITIGSLPETIDSTAIHKSTGSEISIISEKLSPISDDVLLIEDSADINNKKSIKIGNLPLLKILPLTPVEITSSSATVSGVAYADVPELSITWTAVENERAIIMVSGQLYASTGTTTGQVTINIAGVDIVTATNQGLSAFYGVQYSRSTCGINYMSDLLNAGSITVTVRAKKQASGDANWSLIGKTRLSIIRILP